MLRFFSLPDGFLSIAPFSGFSGPGALSLSRASRPFGRARIFRKAELPLFNNKCITYCLVCNSRKPAFLSLTGNADDSEMLSNEFQYAPFKTIIRDDFSESLKDRRGMLSRCLVGKIKL